MKGVFINHPAFRILAPLFMGVLAYLLILLLNNDVSQVSGLFESQEVYVCIVTAILVMEVGRWAMQRLDIITIQYYDWQRPLITFGCNVVLTLILAHSSLHLYFSIWVGFQPGSTELWVFTIIFLVINTLHFVLYLGYILLNKQNEMKLINEELSREALINQFSDFRNDINPSLLFSSLEHLITLAHNNPDQADELIDHLSIVYRYMLGQRHSELVSFADEERVTNALVELLNMLAQFNIDFTINNCDYAFEVVPGTVLSMVEKIAKKTINDPSNPTTIQLYCEDGYLILQYKSNDRLIVDEPTLLADKSQRAYAYYTDKPLVEVNTFDESYVKIPILTVEERNPMTV